MSIAMSKKKSSDNVFLRYKGLYFWIALAFLFDVGIFFIMGADKAIDFAAGYVIEISLSVDNLFVFLLIFISFNIKEDMQHKILNYGIAGTIILRFIFIFVGISLVNRFEWILWVFGALLIFSGAKMLKGEEEDDDPRDGILYKIIAKLLPMSDGFEVKKFIVRNTGDNIDSRSNKLAAKFKHLCTPYMAVMVLIIFSDIIFAIDSVPAVISMTRDMFIVYTSNMFAVMGLRQMFFILEHLHEKFEYVKYGVGVILIFTGVKMLLDIWDIHIHNLVSIGVIVTLLVGSIVVSIIIANRKEKKTEENDSDESTLSE